MKLEDLIRRKCAEPWGEPGKIPWNEPAFSARMLREHLSQDHGRASRRFEDIDRHVAWIHEEALRSKPGRVLDLGCGPGFYTARLSRLGHDCVGVDFSPASISHARAEALRESMRCDYQLADIRESAFAAGFDAVLLLSGELNTFSPADLERILSGSRRALEPSGALVLEVHPEAAVRARGERSPTWFSADRSVFCDQPHLCLIESRWDPESRTAVERFFVQPSHSQQIEAYASTTRAYSESELAALLAKTGFGQLERHRSLGGSTGTPGEDLCVLVCRSGARTG